MNSRSIVGWLVSGSVCLVFAAGCVNSHRAPPVVYTPAPPPPTVIVAPTSDRPVARVYPGPSSTAPAGPPTVVPPAGVSSSDVAVADSVRQLLKGDSDLARVSNHVEATVDHGVVTLRGTVPAEHVNEIEMRLRQLPGIVRVNDQLAVDLR